MKKMKIIFIFCAIILLSISKTMAQTSPVKLGNLMVYVNQPGTQFVNDTTVVLDSTVKINIVYYTSSPKDLQFVSLKVGGEKDAGTIFTKEFEVVSKDIIGLKTCEPIILNGEGKCNGKLNEYDTNNFISISMQCTQSFFAQCKWITLMGIDKLGKTTEKKYFQLNL